MKLWKKWVTIMDSDRFTDTVTDIGMTLLFLCAIFLGILCIVYPLWYFLH